VYLNVTVAEGAARELIYSDILSVVNWYPCLFGLHACSVHSDFFSHFGA